MAGIGTEKGVVLSTTTARITTETETFTIMTDMVIVTMITGGAKISNAILASNPPVSTHQELARRQKNQKRNSETEGFLLEAFATQGKPPTEKCRGTV